MSGGGSTWAYSWSEPRDPTSLSLVSLPAAGVAPAPLPVVAARVGGFQGSSNPAGVWLFSPGQGSVLTPANRVWALLPLPLCWQKDGHVLFPKLLTQASVTTHLL